MGNNSVKFQNISFIKKNSQVVKKNSLFFASHTWI